MPLGRRLGDHGLAVRTGVADYLLEEISPKEMAEMIEDKRKRELRGFPRYFAFRGDIVRIWPTSDQEYQIVII